MQLTALLIVATAICATAAYSTRYDRASLVRVEHSATVAPVLQHIVEKLNLDVWSTRLGIMEVLVAREHRQQFLKMFNTGGSSSRAAVLIDDVQTLIDAEETYRLTHNKMYTRTVDNTQYRDYDQLNMEMDSLEQDFPNLVTSSQIGTTYEGRSIRLMKVSSGSASEAVWIDCGIHAREWVSQATCMYFLDQLTSRYGTDPTITSLVDRYDFHILPITNPDGYVYSWQNDRLWRKNRSPNGNCFGVDCNRNFDSNFGGEGASDLPCADTYHGPSAFSEAESAAIRDAVLQIGAPLKAFFSIHSYSQLWMVPYGYTSTLPADYTELMRVSQIGVEALTAVHGTQYQYGNIADIIYVASGGSIDWVYDGAGVSYCFALELRDTGTFGFLLPAAQIVPTGEETFAGVVAAIEAFA